MIFGKMLSEFLVANQLIAILCFKKKEEKKDNRNEMHLS